MTGCDQRKPPPTEQNMPSVVGLLKSDKPINTHGIGKAKLSEYGFFKGELKQFLPATERVIAYRLNSELFSDYAKKKRFIALPEGAVMQYSSDEVLEFPVGTTLIKNFYYSARELAKADQNVVLETRLLIKEQDGWQALPYIWNDQQTDAYLNIFGREIDVRLKGDEQSMKIAYLAPNINQCKSCHSQGGKVSPIGPTARNLNTTNHEYHQGANQLTLFSERGDLKGLPENQTLPFMVDYRDLTVSLESRARAYLDINCAHCHRRSGSAKNTGMYTRWNEQDPYVLGINKQPVAAGHGTGNRSFNIVKGYPDKSILIYRMQSQAPEVMMPEMGRTLVHQEGVALISDWIASLE